MQECKNYTIKYRLYLDSENQENRRLKTYLEQSEQTANSYIKNLIKRDLDDKGFMLDGSVTTDIPGSHKDNNDGIVADMDI